MTSLYIGMPGTLTGPARPGGSEYRLPSIHSLDLHSYNQYYGGIRNLVPMASGAPAAGGGYVPTTGGLNGLSGMSGVVNVNGINGARGFGGIECGAAGSAPVGYAPSVGGMLGYNRTGSISGARPLGIEYGLKEEFKPTSAHGSPLDHSRAPSGGSEQRVSGPPPVPQSGRGSVSMNSGPASATSVASIVSPMTPATPAPAPTHVSSVGVASNLGGSPRSSLNGAAAGHSGIGSSLNGTLAVSPIDRLNLRANADDRYSARQHPYTHTSQQYFHQPQQHSPSNLQVTPHTSTARSPAHQSHESVGGDNLTTLCNVASSQQAAQAKTEPQAMNIKVEGESKHDTEGSEVADDEDSDGASGAALSEGSIASRGSVSYDQKLSGLADAMKSEQDAASAKASKPRKKRQCPECKLFFSNLATHKSTHLKPASRPHVCKHCGRGFARPNDLFRHIKCHWKETGSDKGQFKCPYKLVDSGNHCCHPTGIFSRCDTFKNHLKAIHFKYPNGTKKENRNKVSGHCRMCNKFFNNVDEWIINHVEKNDCTFEK